MPECFFKNGSKLCQVFDKQWFANVIKLDWTNIQIYLVAQEFTKWILKYFQMSKIWPNKYPKIFGCSRNIRINIWTYSDVQDLTEQISEYSQTGKNTKINSARFYWNIDHSNFCVITNNRSTQTEIGLTLSKLLPSVQRLVKYTWNGPKEISKYICLPKNQMNKHPNILRWQRIGQIDILIWLDWRKPWIQLQTLFLVIFFKFSNILKLLLIICDQTDP